MWVKLKTSLGANLTNKNLKSSFNYQKSEEKNSVLISPPWIFNTKYHDAIAML